MQKGSTSVMQRASFERPKHVFVTAATYGERNIDIHRCLSTSTITGGVCGVGTGMVQVYTDPEKYVPPPPDLVPLPLTTLRPSALPLPKPKVVKQAPPKKIALQWWDHTRSATDYITEFYVEAAKLLTLRRTVAPPRRKRVREDAESTLLHETLDFLHGALPPEPSGVAVSKEPTFSFAAQPFGDADLNYMRDEFVFTN